MSLIRAASVNFDSTLRLCRNGSDRRRGIASQPPIHPPTHHVSQVLGETRFFSHIAAAVAVGADKFNRVRVLKLERESIGSIYTFGRGIIRSSSTVRDENLDEFGADCEINFPMENAADNFASLD